MESILLYLIDHFPDLMDFNLTASIVILFVICVRQFLKRAPKIFSYALWGVVLLRLLVPVSIESSMSVIPDRTEFSSIVEVNDVLPRIEFEAPQDRADNEWHRENTAPGEPLVQTYRSLDAETYLTFAWLIGIAVMLLRSIVSYWKLKRKLKVVIPFRKGIYIADDIDTPFVMGFFRPVIYLPGTLDNSEWEYIIAHERHHIHRGDHIFKALGFLALTIHWFNPLVWVAFVLAGRDMEMSCDEAVIRKLGEDVRAEYSASLLNLATGKRLFAGTPLAFDEGAPTERVRNLAKWKKPAFWVILICAIVCVVLAVCLLTDPSKDVSEETHSYEQYYVIDEQSVVVTGVARDSTIAVKFKKTSGPRSFVVDLQYKTKEDSAWTRLSPQTLAIAKTYVFQIPTGCSYMIEVIPTLGANGYATFEISDQGVYALADIDKSSVNQIKLQNCHNGKYTFLSDEVAISEICAFLNGIVGVDYGSSKGYYEGTYAVTLQFSDTSEYFTVVFGDSSSFNLGQGDDGYPIRYELLGLEIQDVVEFLSQYDSSGFDWAMLGQTEATEETEPASKWDVFITPERVSRTGAAAIFNYSGSVPGEEGSELTYGDFLSLDRWENDTWDSVEELPDYDYYVGDSSYPVMDGYGMVHEWDNRFGELPDGTYRLGKLLTLTRTDGTTSQQMVYGEFNLPEDILTGPIPLEELPELYSAEQAMIDGCLVSRDGEAMDNIEVFREFAERCNGGEAGFFRIVDWYYGDNPHYIARDINYDGSKYTISWLEDGRRQSADYHYLKHFTGEKERENIAYDAYEHYVLVNDNDVTWLEIWEGMISSQYGAAIDHMTIFSDYIYYPDTVEIPNELAQADLVYGDLELVTVTNSAQLENIQELFASAEVLGYEPKTHSIGIGLNLVLTAENGETMTIELDPDNDLCRIYGEYVFYGAADEPSYILKLWEYLGLQAWPEFLYESCPNAFRPLSN